MYAYVIRRIVAVIPVMAVVGIFVFLLLHLTPGDPAAIIAGDYASPPTSRRSARGSASTSPSTSSSLAGSPILPRAISGYPSSPTCR